jgi:hypothetical protein
MADKNDQNPVNNISADILLAQAKPKPDPRPDLRLIPGGRSFIPKVPSTVSIPKLPRTSGPGAPNPWLIFFTELVPRIFDAGAVGNVRSEQEAIEARKRREDEAEKQRQSTQTDQKPSGTQQKPAQTPQQNPPVFYNQILFQTMYQVQ